MIGLGLWFFGAEGSRTPPFTDATFHVGDITVSGQSVLVLLSSLILIGARGGSGSRRPRWAAQRDGPLGRDPPSRGGAVRRGRQPGRDVPRAVGRERTGGPGAPGPDARSVRRPVSNGRDRALRCRPRDVPGRHDGWRCQSRDRAPGAAPAVARQRKPSLRAVRGAVRRRRPAGHAVSRCGRGPRRVLRHAAGVRARKPDAR